jgi:hypothetical protein
MPYEYDSDNDWMVWPILFMPILGGGWYVLMCNVTKRIVENQALIKWVLIAPIEVSLAIGVLWFLINIGKPKK